MSATFFTIMILYATDTVTSFKPVGPMGPVFIGISLLFASIFLLVSLICLCVPYELIYALRQTRLVVNILAVWVFLQQCFTGVFIHVIFCGVTPIPLLVVAAFFNSQVSPNP